MVRKKINEPLEIRGMKLENRISFSPITTVVDTDESGIVTSANVEALRRIAKGGTALIFQGATAVSKENRFTLTQAGIWCDEQIEGLRQITDAVHAEGKKIIIQLQHAGIRSCAEKLMCSSDYVLNTRRVRVGKAMTVDEIRVAEQEFIDAAKRAVSAGYDGVELHASHGWLLSDFLNRKVNVRDDEYGRDRTLIIREIYEGIRTAVPDDFVVGIRTAGYEPELEDGLEHARQLDEMGFDFLDISNTNDALWPLQNVNAPQDYPLTALAYAAGEMKKFVKAPIMVVKGVCTADDANRILELSDVDMVQVGRSILVDPEWTNKALSGRTPGKCLGCQGGCKWNVSGPPCPGQIMMAKSVL